MSAEWMPVAAFSTGLEADIARATLESAGIPVRLRSNRAGLFGATFQGFVPGGVTLEVPSPELARARDLLDEEAA
jgi:putative signal transducing protein